MDAEWQPDNDDSRPLVVGGVTFAPLRLPVPQIARGLPREIHVFSREMVEAEVAAERERCAALVEEKITAGGPNWHVWMKRIVAEIRGPNGPIQRAPDAP